MTKNLNNFKSPKIFHIGFFLFEGALHVLSVTASRESPRDCSAPISKVVSLDHLTTLSTLT